MKKRQNNKTTTVEAIIENEALNMLRGYPVLPMMQDVYKKHNEELEALQSKLEKKIQNILKGYKHVIETCPIDENKKQEFYKSINRYIKGRGTL